MRLPNWAVLALANGAVVLWIVVLSVERDADEPRAHGSTHPAMRALLVGGEEIVYAVRYAPNGSWLVTASELGTLTIWNARDGQKIRTLRGHKDEVLGVAVGPEGRRVVSACGDGSVKLWSVETGREIRSFQGHKTPVWAVDFSGDGSLIASGSEDGSIHVHQAATATVLRTIHAKGRVNSVCFSPRNTLFVATYGGVFSNGQNDMIVEYDPESGTRLRTLRDVGYLCTFSISRDGRRLASVGSEGMILWDLEAVKVLHLFPRQSAVVFTPDGARIVSVRGRNVTVWDVSTAAEIGGWWTSGLDPTGIALSPNGKFLAIAAEGSAIVWDMSRKIAPDSSTPSCTADTRWIVAAGHEPLRRGGR